MQRATPKRSLLPLPQGCTTPPRLLQPACHDGDQSGSDQQVRGWFWHGVVEVCRKHDHIVETDIRRISPVLSRGGPAGRAREVYKRLTGSRSKSREARNPGRFISACAINDTPVRVPFPIKIDVRHQADENTDTKAVALTVSSFCIVTNTVRYEIFSARNRGEPRRNASTYGFEGI